MRRSILAVLAAALVFLGLAGAATAAGDVTAMTNADRTARGLAGLTPAGDLQAFAQRRAEEMAKAGRLWHSPELDAVVGNWKRLGENVGRGAGVSEIHHSFMASGRHRDNILLPNFSEIGVGVASDGGQLLYVAVVFREPAGGIAPAVPAPRQAAVKPRPAPRVSRAPRASKAKPAPAPPTTVAAPAPPPAPPVEAVPPPPVEAPAAPVVPEVRPRRPVVEERWFLAANEGNFPLPRRPVAPRPALAGATLGLLGVCGVVHHGLRRRLLQPPA